MKRQMINCWTILLSALLLACAGIGLAALAQATTKESSTQVATVNGEPIPDQILALYLRYARSDAQAQAPGKDVTAAAEHSALRSAEVFMVQLQQGRRLGLISADAVPFSGDNMAKLRVNTSGYGTSQLSDKEVVDRFLANVREALISKLMPESAVEKALRATYLQHKSSHQQIQEMTVRRIRLPYTSADRSATFQLAKKLRGQAAAGADFVPLATNWDHAYYSDSGFQNRDNSFRLTGKEKFADPTLVQTAKTLADGQVSKVVDSGDAYYVVKMVAKEAVQLTFAQVQDQLYYTYTDARYSTLLKQWLANAKVRVSR
ncbi:hypothetical protein HLK59_22495 [Streptomyces sp. S3(2020)]|uniref:peptidylprolyl isomerase n=1 Tax=Streptomyces sp. S3(2020) TaxID=2732044 RepID=UPI001487BBD9|nr:peptidyl-prolyl cis-trans isomerase [Streptomyces sp. S3(2020)]NNN33076.1 hypothetical protein [Streptomyces sp. S3(2020)]